MTPINKIKKLIKDIGDLKKRKSFSVFTRIKKDFPEAEIYLVGGAVRDLILGRETKDYDFVIRKLPHQKISAFLAKHGRVDYVGRVFGVFKFLPKQTDESLEPIDIALPRTEHVHAGTGAYKDFRVRTDPHLLIEKDLKRRDFTINAMAVNFDSGEIIDPAGGLKDIDKKIIRTVGPARERLTEDYSRLLRGLRFACQLDFKIEKNTWLEIKQLVEKKVLTKQINPTPRPAAGYLGGFVPQGVGSADDIKHKSLTSPQQVAGHDGEGIKNTWVVPRETVGREIVKALYAAPSRAFELFEESGLFALLMPEIEAMKNCPQPLPWHNEGDVFVHTKMAMAHLAGSPLWRRYFGKEKPSALAVTAVLLHDIGKPPCLTTPQKHGTDRIRFDEHEPVGAEMARKICDRLALSSSAAGTPLHIDVDKLSWLIGHHLLLLHVEPDKMRGTTVEKYFFSPQNPGRELLQLSLCDTGATIHAETKKPYLDSFKAMLKRIKQMEKLKAEKNRLPPPILDGHEIMAALNIPPGPKIGNILNELRELQLAGKIKTKKQAIKIIKKL